MTNNELTPPITTSYANTRNPDTQLSLSFHSCCTVCFVLCIFCIILENMAEEETGIYVNQEQFSCPICMDLLREPVTIPCGHNYCMDCIKSFWEQKNQRKVCSCPECRQTFSPRPTLNKNTLFAEVVERMRHTGIRSQAVSEDKINEGISKEKQELIMYCEVCMPN